MLDLLAFIHTLQLELLEALQVCAVPSQHSYNHKNPVLHHLRKGHTEMIQLVLFRCSGAAGCRVDTGFWSHLLGPPIETMIMYILWTL